MKSFRYYYLITLLLFIGINYSFGQAQNQEVTPHTALYPFEENGLYGLIDSVGQVVFEAQFSQILRADVQKSEYSIKKFNRELKDRWTELREGNRRATEHNRTTPRRYEKHELSEVPTSQNKLLFLPYKDHAFYFLNEWAVIRIDGIYGYINYKGEKLLNAKDSSKAFFRNSSARTFDFNWEFEAEKIRTKIELLHPDKYVSIRPIINYPHLIIVYRDNKKGQIKAGLLKLDTLKNKTEIIIPTNKNSIEYDFRKGFVKVNHGDQDTGAHRTRLFNLSKETFWNIEAKKK